MILKIQTGQNNPILKQKCQPIEKIGGEILKMAKDMVETMIKAHGVGLATPQVGKNIQLFVVHPTLSKKNIFINPKITKISKKIIIEEEGCLSLPNVFISTKRAESLKIKAINENGKEFKIKAKNLLARVIQHEIDHLNGILICDNVKQN